MKRKRVYELLPRTEAFSLKFANNSSQVRSKTFALHRSHSHQVCPLHSKYPVFIFALKVRDRVESVNGETNIPMSIRVTETKNVTNIILRIYESFRPKSKSHKDIYISHLLKI